MKVNSHRGKILSTLFFVPLALTTLSHTANAADSTINITGTVVASPCTIEAEKTIKLGDIDASKLATTGSSSPFVSFSVNLSECPATTTSAVATFSGTAADTDYYANTGEAKNVDIELVSSYSSANLGNGKTYNVSIDSTTHAAAYNMKTRVRNDGKGSAVTPGSVSSAIQMSIAYK